MLFQDETLDHLFPGNIKIFQKKKGYRFSIDSILLAHFVRLKEGQKVVDLGTGSGVIPIILAKKAKSTEIWGVEIQDELAKMAKRNIEINHLQGRVHILQGDARNLVNRMESEEFDIVLTNPPYRKIRSGRLNPQRQKAIARHEIKGSLTDMAKIGFCLLRPKASFYLVYPAVRIADLITCVRESHLEPKRLRLVHPNMEKGAQLILVEAIKWGRPGVEIHPPLFIYDLNGQYSEEMRSIYSSTTEFSRKSGNVKIPKV
ncbi:MAG: tRNA1(Val) (adenine(37)-N6)-methyltransferase [Syntrophobacterales bacterium]|nr:MAG: tRNA1(Val) (adenine(37)-N6)-methyltransferase [Syntrophobacterales bacterium]